MIPQIIHRVWLGPEMPPEYQRFGERWAELHKGWRVKTWSWDDLGWLRNRKEFDVAAQWSTKANIARYEIVLREGGLYVDTDFEPLKPFDEVIEGVSLVLGEQQPGVLNNALFAAEPGHPFLEYLVAELPSSFHALATGSSPERCGPNFMTRCYRRWSAQVPHNETRILGPEDVYPYNYLQPHLRGRPVPHALAVHHWAKSWVGASTAGHSWQGTGRSVTKGFALRVKRRVDKIARSWASLDGLPGPGAHVSVNVGDGRLMTNTSAGFPILSVASDLGVTPSLVTRGIYDPTFISFLRTHLKPGDTFVDVGSNIGLFTIAAGWHLRSPGTVIAYEPNPEVYLLLRDNVYMNKMLGMRANVIVKNIAASAQRGSVQLRVPRKHPGMASTVAHANTNPDETVFDVDSVALDEDLRRIPEIRLLKIDVEGGELAVLRGLKQTLSDRRVRLLDLELIDEHLGPEWPHLVEELRAISIQFHASTFAIDSRGQLVPLTVDQAVHSDRLQHFVFQFSY